MKELSFYNQYKKPIVLALGFFDCIHKGHKTLVDKVIELSKKYECSSSLLTFSTDPSECFDIERQIYCYDKRKLVLENLGLDIIVSTEFNSNFFNKSKDEFLDILTTNFDIKEIVCGSDYKFGKNAEGDVDYLSNYLQNKSIKLQVVPFLMRNNLKLSTTDLRTLIKNGDIEEVNECLSQPYFSMGNVVEGKHNGKKLSFPTANIMSESECCCLKNAVYITKTYVDGKSFKSITNIGEKPTFGDYSINLESHLFDFDEDIYGKEIRIEFLKKIRDNQKFENPNLLSAQIEKDKKYAEKYFLQSNEL